MALPVRRLWLFFAGGALVVIGMVALAAWMIEDSRRTARAHATQSSENIVEAIEHDIKRDFEIYDLSLLAVRDGLQLPGIWSLDPEIRRAVLFDRATDAPHLGAVLVLDRAGRILIDSRSAVPPNLNFAGGDYFIAHRDHRDLGLLVTGPVKDQLSGEWSLILSRRLDNPDGSFAGVALGSMELELFRQMFQRIDVGLGGHISMMRTTGALVVREPFNETDINRDVSAGAVLRAFAKARRGTVEAAGLVDGGNRLFAYRQVGNLPFVLNVALSMDTVQGEWRSKAALIIIVVLGLTTLAVLLAVSLMSELRRRNATERMLAEKSAILEATLQTMDQGLMVVSADRTVPLCNARAIELLSLPPELMARQPRFDEVLEHQFRSGEFQQSEESFRAWVRAGGVSDDRQIYERERPNGVVLEIRTVPLAGGGGVRTYTDITRRKQAEAELAAAKVEAESAAEEAGRAREAAEAASRSKSEFLANMSHELRTPLNAVMGFAEIIRDALMGPVDQRYQDYARDIYESGGHLLSVIKDVLDLSKIEVGRLDLQEETIDLAALIASCESIVKGRAKEAGLTLAAELPDELPVLCDGRRMKQIVLNLLSNAVKFTPSGGRVSVMARQLASSEYGGGELAIAVTDTGIGMRPEDVAIALEPFRQIDSAMTRRYEGTGLGLPLVQRLVALHGGTLQIDTAPGIGTTVTITLPASRCAADRARRLVGC
ncbi:MAG: PAS-domain containing protein [Alphaproteobacteria bacterium]|nr:PAS-domain containing protein [Alphaproteobacteria bacterium]